MARVSEICSEYPEKASIDFSTARNGVKIIDYFNISAFGKNAEDDYIFDGIGACEGNTIVCPDWLISLEDSYLRFSGIIAPNEEEIKNKYGAPIQIKGPAIIILKNGASFFVDKEMWEYYSSTDSIILQPKIDVSGDWLLFLIGWLKSNI